MLTLLFRGDIDHTGLRQRRVLGQEPRRLRRGPRRRPARAAQRASTPHGSSTCGPTTRTRTTSRSGSSPLGRDTSATIDSALSGGAPATASRTKATTRSPASTSRTAIRESTESSARRIPQPFHDGWRVFYTQQHGDNVTWEILPTGSGPSFLPHRRRLTVFPPSRARRRERRAPFFERDGESARPAVRFGALVPLTNRRFRSLTLALAPATRTSSLPSVGRLFASRADEGVWLT